MRFIRIMQKNIILLTAMGDYRKKVITHLMTRIGNHTELWAGVLPFDHTVKTISPQEILFKEVNNIYILKKKFMIQLASPLKLISCKTLLTDLNPRILNLWIILSIRTMLGKKNIVWGHAWPRDGSKSGTVIIRKLLCRLADTIIVYTETQANELRAELPNKHIIAAPNALYYKSEIGFAKNSNRTKILYVGRLVSDKKPNVLLNAFLQDSVLTNPDIELYFIGSGPERKILEGKIKNLSDAVKSRIHFLGHVSDYATLKQHYDASFVSISAGYVGLSITQSFSFGVPMLISKDEPHAPELEAAKENFNFSFFKTDCPIDLANKIVSIWDKKKHWEANGDSIAEECKQSYSAENMSLRIAGALD